MQSNEISEIEGLRHFSGNVMGEITNLEVHVTAEVLSSGENGSVYEGKVELRAGGKLIRADRLVVRQAAHVTHLTAESLSIEKTNDS